MFRRPETPILRAMTDPSIPHRDELRPLLEQVLRETLDHLEQLDDLPVRSPRQSEAAASFDGQLPDTGVGAATALHELLAEGFDAAAISSGPRFFHFVMGGVTPAAFAADWFTTTLDQIAYAWIGSPLAVRLETLSIAWLRELFELPTGGGILTTGATMANFVGLAAARQWWGRQHGVDVSEQGFVGLPAVPVLSSGHVHPSAVKAISMLGIGRHAVQRFTADGTGRLDVEGLQSALRELNGAPAIVIANAGEVNAGDFDPIAVMADLAQQHGAWLHVDGAFGLFARVSPRTRHLTEGVERADSITADGHKWLNVPYDCGFSFIRDASLLPEVFAYDAAYLADDDDERPNFGVRGPEGSRRARAFAVWATLRAYGRDGYRALVEGHLDLAQRLARAIDEAPELERLADVPLNIVCFRLAPEGWSEDERNELNQQLADALLEDGRYYAGATRYDGRVALRPAFVNWRTRPQDVDGFLEVVRELGARLMATAAARTRTPD
jgi:glutamate/tyrosine decarboxylase-like PLP-dependent enzyme